MNSNSHSVARKYLLVLGIAAGFLVLYYGALVVADITPASARAIPWVGLCCTLLSIFILASERPKSSTKSK
jgi:hypothetical protein